MRWPFVFRYVGMLTFILGLTLLFPIGFSLFYKDGDFTALLASMVLTLSSGAMIFYWCRGEKTEHISQREAMAIVTLGWTAVALFAAFPFYFSGIFETFTDSFFESMSGFTTTGASVMTNIEAVPRGLLFWRSFIQWLGGMGIIVLSIAILPLLGVGGYQLYKFEVPSPMPDRLKPRIKDTAKILWKVYLAFTFLAMMLLMLGGMGFYDAICHALATMPTGGFSPRNLSMAHFDSAYFDAVIIIFMLAAGLNFSLHYQMLMGKPLIYWKNPESRFFLAVVGILCLAVYVDIFGTVYHTIGDTIRFGTFQVVSIITTTGFATADFNQWPAMSKMILFFCMFAGASAGSTAGGMKMMRIMCALKYCYKEIFSLIHPHGVSNVKIGGKSISDDIMGSILSFLVLYMALFAFCTVLLAGMGVDFLTALSAVAATIGNIGPGLAAVGPAGNYADIPYMGKWLLSWCMLMGRLEIYTVIIFLAPEFWRK
jgi:trk system potassium uptake protein